MDEIKGLIYPELSYKLLGLAFKVYNQLGYGYQEKYYQRAFAHELNLVLVFYENSYRFAYL